MSPVYTDKGSSKIYGSLFSMKTYISFLKNSLIKNKIIVILSVVVCAAGFISGIFFNTYLEKTLLGKNIVDFYVDALMVGGNVGGWFFLRLFSDLVLSVIFLGCSFISALIIVDWLFLFYKCYVAGLAACVFIMRLGLSGFMLFLFCVFLGDVIVTAALLLFSVVAGFSDKNGCKKPQKQKLGLFLLCFCVCLLGELVQLIILFCYLRPVNFNY